MLLVFFLLTDVILILFQEKSFDLRFFDLLTIDSLIVGLQQFSFYSMAIILLLAILFFTARLVLKKIKYTEEEIQGKHSVFFSLIIILLLFIVPSSFSFFTNKVVSYQLYKKNLKDNVQLPQIELNATKGKNLLLIYLESFETEFTEKKNFPKLTPFLQKLVNNSISFESNYMIDGASYSMAGMFASQCGAPYQYLDTKNLICLGDILHEAGYKQVFMQGTDMQYEDMGDYYTKHGYDELDGKKKLLPIGDPDKANYWGITDEDLFEYAYASFMKLNKDYIENKQAYNLTLFTSDTHDGEPSKSCPKYQGLFEENHFFQSYHCSDYLLKKFITKIRAQSGSEDLVIAIIGDHLQNFDIYASKLNKMNRRVTAFINTPDNKGIKIMQPTAHIDFTPTLLPAMGVENNTEFLFGKNAIKPMPKDHIKSLYKSNDGKKLYKMVDADTWIGSIGITKKEKKKKITDLYWYGAEIKAISKDEVKKYFFPEIKNFKNFSNSNVKIFYSVDDNILFIKTDKLFETAHLHFLAKHFLAKDDYFYDGNISISRAINLPDNWYAWVFGNHFKNVTDLKIEIDLIDRKNMYPFPMAMKVINSDTKIIDSKLTAEISFKNINPEDGDQVGIKMLYDTNIEKIKFYISDLYADTSYPNRIKYKVIYQNKILFIGDIGDKQGIKKHFIEINLLPDDKNVVVLLEAQEGIEDDSEWGHAAKIKIDFFSNS